MEYIDMGAKFHAFFSSQVQIGGEIKEILNGDKTKCLDKKHNSKNDHTNDNKHIKHTK
jgi:hypothetical protein